MVGLSPQPELPAEFLASIPQHLDSLLGEPTMAIGGWNSGTENPISVALSSTGQLSSIVAVHPDHIDSLPDTLTSVDEWLSPMSLRDLSDLSGNSVEFYEGLLNLSPEASITLSAQRRYLIVTAGEAISTDHLSQRLPDAHFDVLCLDVMHAPGCPVVVRQRGTGTLPPPPITTAPKKGALPVAPPIPEYALNEAAQAQAAQDEAVPSEAVPDDAPAPVMSNQWTDVVVPGDTAETEIPEESLVADADVADPDVAEAESPGEQVVEEIDLTELEAEPEVVSLGEESALVHNSAHTFSVAPEVDSEETIDLTATPAPPATMIGDDTPELHLAPGSTYDVDLLPLIFDSTGASIESISNEMFAVSDSIVIVVSLPDRRRDSPFEDRRKFRWDTSLDRIQLLNEHGFTRHRTRRDVHLFVENERQPGYAAYVGALSRIAFQTQTESNAETAWFSISPSLNNDFYKLIRKGRLPSHDAKNAKAL